MNWAAGAAVATDEAERHTLHAIANIYIPCYYFEACALQVLPSQQYTMAYLRNLCALHVCRTVSYCRCCRQTLLPWLRASQRTRLSNAHMCYHCVVNTYALFSPFRSAGAAVRHCWPDSKLLSAPG
jgi:hypothetical protein